VQRRFKMAIRFGFYLAILNFARVIINQVGIWIKSPLLYYIAIVMYGVNFMLMLIWFMFTQMWRWSHSGMVCSGDFLSKEQRQEFRQQDNQGLANGYIVAEGNFLKGILIAIYMLIGLLILTVIAVALFFSQKRTQEELDARKGGLFKTDMAPSYESKINRRKTLLG
jgi:uncharacterized membrane protein YciS (DUF1049 family)